MIARIALWCLVGCIAVPVLLRCESPAPWRFGVAGGAGVQFHSSDFASLPPVALPAASAPFTTARGPALFLGAEVYRRIAPWLYAGIQADIQNWNGAFDADEPAYFVIGGVGTPGVITHSLDLSMTSLAVSPVLSVPLGSAWSLDAGLRINYLLSNSYEQSMAVTEPEGLPFLDGETRQIVSSGAFTDEVRTVSLALTAAVRYNIDIGGPFALAPELRAQYGLSSLMEDVDWTMSGLRGALALVYAPPERLPVVLHDTVYRRDTVSRLVAGLEQERLTLTSSSRVEHRTERDDLVLMTLDVEESYLREIPRPKALLAAAVDVRFVQNNGEESQSTTVTVEGVLTRHYMPLLPYIFFAEGSAELSERYRAPRLPTADPMLALYYTLLDTVGARMNARPRAALTLTGSTADAGVEQGAEALARRRAEAVRDYLEQTWNIRRDRLRIAARVLPASASALSTVQGMEENRRVELSSDDEQILAPVVVADTSVIADPPVVRFYPDVVSEAGVASWYLAVDVNGDTLRSFSGGASPPARIEWDIASTPSAMRLLTGDVPAMRYSFSARDIEGSVSQVEPGIIRFQEAASARGSIVHRTTDRYSLILFDYNTADPGRENRAVLRLIRSEVAPRDSVEILGFTDVTGDEAYNRRLSLRRAETIAAALGLPRSRVVGTGVAGDLPQHLPEGRFYSRRVDVVRERR